MCTEIPLINKLRKTFDNKTSSDSLVSFKSTFYVYNSGNDMIISYPLLQQIHKSDELSELIHQNAADSGEAREEQDHQDMDIGSQHKLYTETTPDVRRRTVHD